MVGVGRQGPFGCVSSPILTILEAKKQNVRQILASVSRDLDFEPLMAYQGKTLLCAQAYGNYNNKSFLLYEYCLYEYCHGHVPRAYAMYSQYFSAETVLNCEL